MTRTILYSLIFAVAFMAFTFALGQARAAGMIGEETMTRTVQVIIGLGLAAWSNFTPKQIGAAGSPLMEAAKQRLLRVTGWAMVLAGLSYAGLWAFAPLEFANSASVAVVLTALAITLGYAARTAATCRSIAAGSRG